MGELAKFGDRVRVKPKGNEAPDIGIVIFADEHAVKVALEDGDSYSALAQCEVEVIPSARAAEVERLKREIRKCERGWERAQDGWVAAQNRNDELRAKIDSLTTQLTAAHERIASLERKACCAELFEQKVRALMDFNSMHTRDSLALRIIEFLDDLSEKRAPSALTPTEDIDRG